MAPLALKDERCSEDCFDMANVAKSLQPPRASTSPRRSTSVSQVISLAGADDDDAVSGGGGSSVLENMARARGGTRCPPELDNDNESFCDVITEVEREYLRSIPNARLRDIRREIKLLDHCKAFDAQSCPINVPDIIAINARVFVGYKKGKFNGEKQAQWDALAYHSFVLHTCVDRIATDINNRITCSSAELSKLVLEIRGALQQYMRTVATEWSIVIAEPTKILMRRLEALKPPAVTTCKNGYMEIACMLKCVVLVHAVCMHARHCHTGK